jgi:hypothetical protein
VSYIRRQKWQSGQKKAAEKQPKSDKNQSEKQQKKTVQNRIKKGAKRHKTARIDLFKYRL